MNPFPLSQFLPALLAVSAIANEIPIAPKIDSVGLFKNGLCIVHSSFEATEPGTFVWTDPPRCVHGTFVVESGIGVTLTTGTRMVDESTDRPTGNLQNDLAGQRVRIRLRSSAPAGETEISGRVWQWADNRRAPRQWSNTIAGESPSYRDQSSDRMNPPATTGNYLVIEGEQKRVYVDISQIAAIETLEAPRDRKRTVEKPVMVVRATRAGVIRFSYLSRGASWVPSYRVDLSDAKTLRISQTALVRNELAPWKDVRIGLITGFPNIRFGDVDSPLWPGTTLANFFAQTSRDGRPTGAMSSRLGEARQPEAPMEGLQSEDMHFEWIGAQDLDPGETLSLEVARGAAEYERVVEWALADSRNETGNNYRTDQQANEDNQPWDAVLFQNPLEFPMTTAAAAFTENGQFLGQTLSKWAHPKQRVCLRITRALSIQGDRKEIEEPGKRESVSIAGYNYYRTTVKGTLTMRSARALPAVILCRAQYSGELISADEAPTNTRRKDVLFSANPQHELEWKLTLAPGEEKQVTYRYSVLVRN